MALRDPPSAAARAEGPSNGSFPAITNGSTSGKSSNSATAPAAPDTGPVVRTSALIRSPRTDASTVKAATSSGPEAASDAEQSARRPPQRTQAADASVRSSSGGRVVWSTRYGWHTVDHDIVDEGSRTPRASTPTGMVNSSARSATPTTQSILRQPLGTTQPAVRRANVSSGSYCAPRDLSGSNVIPATASTRTSPPPSPRSTITAISTAPHTRGAPASTSFRSTATVPMPTTVTPLGGGPTITTGGYMTPPQPYGPTRVTITPPRSPRGTIWEGVTTPLAPVSPRILQNFAPVPARVLPPVRATPGGASVPICATAQAMIPGSSPDEVGSVAVVTAWSELAPPGYPAQNHLVTTRRPIVRPPSPEQRTANGSGHPHFGSSSASGSAEAGSSIGVTPAPERLRPESDDQHQTRQASPSAPSSPRFAALEARCLELERNLTGKDAQLRELHEMAQRTARELERKERQVEEVKLHCSALTQKLEESETETAAIAQRAQELELEVQRMAAFREERERRRNASASPEPSQLSDFDSQVRQSSPRSVGGAGDYRDLPTLATLRQDLRAHKNELLAAQREGSGVSPQERVPIGSSRRASAAEKQRTGSTLSTDSREKRSSVGSNNADATVDSPRSRGKRASAATGFTKEKLWR